MKSARKPTPAQALIHKFVIPEFFASKGFWGKEIKIINQLVKKYSLEFMEWVKIPFGYKINSFVYFLSEQGANYLREQYYEFLKQKIDLSPKPPKPLDNPPIIVDTIPVVQKVKKPTTLQEFLDIYE